MTYRAVRLIACAACVTALVACGDDWYDQQTPPQPSGSLTLGITDAPVDSATRVVIQFSGVQIQATGGDNITITYATPRQIDLLALHGGVSELLLDGEQLLAGNYAWIDLAIDTADNETLSFIEYDDGSIFPLVLTAEGELLTRVVRAFTVPEDGNVDLTIDFDLRRSVIRPPGTVTNHSLRPSMRMVDNSESGAISGTIDTAVITPLIALGACTPAVYVFTGHDATPSDVQIGSGPLSTAFVRMDNAGVYGYRAAFLTEGDYTVAFTCEADLDDPVEEDTIVFLGGTVNAIVVAGEDTEINFPD